MTDLSDLPDPSSAPPGRRLPKRLKIVVISLLVAANLAALAVLWVIRAGGDILATASTNSEVAGVLDEAGGDALTFLIVGSDSRAGLDDMTHFAGVAGGRGDVIMLIRLSGSGSPARALSIPRDLWVEIAGRGPNRINAAYSLGGPSLLVETIQQNLGVEVNHYVEVGFVGFTAVIDQLGGIEMAFPRAARDRQSGLDVAAGSQLLDGDMALAYARSRAYQERRDGRWVSVDADDIGRTGRQREVLGAVLSKLKSPSSVAEAGDIAAALAKHMTIDSNLASASVAALAWDFRGLLTSGMEGAALPVETRRIEGKSVVVAVQPEADSMLAAFRSGRPIAEERLRLEVLNGNGISGSASAASQVLEAEGFDVRSIGDAETKDYATTAVLVPEGSDAGDRVVAALGFGEVRVGSVDNRYDAVVIVGADAPR